MNKRLVLFLSLLMNIAVFSQETDTLHITQEDSETSVFKGGFSDPIDEMWELRESYKRGTFSLRLIDPIISFFPDILPTPIDSL